MASFVLLISFANAFRPGPANFNVPWTTTDNRDSSNRMKNLWSSPTSNDFPIEPLVDDDDDDLSSHPGESGNIHIPTTGISVNDEMEEANRDRYITTLVPVDDVGMPSGVAATLVTRPLLSQSFEPLRYIVALSPPKNNTLTDYVMVDIPPYSPQLLAQIQSFLGTHSNGRLRAIVITNRNAIHYDDAPSVYSIRRADVNLWRKALPDVPIFGYRLDVPRDCRFAVAQVLDGYGPFALVESKNDTFVETGRPLTAATWDATTAEQVMSGTIPIDEVEGWHHNDSSTAASPLGDDNEYAPEAIRRREANSRLLAVYTPGHSFGSLSFVFPQTGVCCSGFTIPCEDPRMADNVESSTVPGPMLDYRGFVTTSQDQRRQMESAKSLIETYSDRFRLLLPSRGDPLLLSEEQTNEERKQVLLQNLAQYELLGEIYQQLGIVEKESAET